ncbi:MAG: hypothetical protein R2867_43750 [Caldilineaceae bacterium]
MTVTATATATRQVTTTPTGTPIPTFTATPTPTITPASCDGHIETVQLFDLQTMQPVPGSLSLQTVRSLHWLLCRPNSILM